MRSLRLQQALLSLRSHLIQDVSIARSDTVSVRWVQARTVHAGARLKRGNLAIATGQDARCVALRILGREFELVCIKRGLNSEMHLQDE